MANELHHREEQQKKQLKNKLKKEAIFCQAERVNMNDMSCEIRATGSSFVLVEFNFKRTK